MHTQNGTVQSFTIISNGAQNELAAIYHRLDQLGLIEERKGLLSDKQEREYSKLTARETDLAGVQ